MQYSISSDGKLTFQNYTRVGKNTDSARLNFYNNKVFVSSIGGMEVGDITYKTDNGQGQYEYTPAEDVPDTSAITNSTTLQKSRVATATEANAEAGKYVSALYSENTTSKAEPMIIDMNGQDLTLVAASTSKIASGIFAGTNQYITIKNDTKDKTLNISATNTDTRGSSGIKADGNAHLTMQNTYFSNSYTTYQLGFDKKVANNWTVGAAVSYNDGSSSYDLSGRGDNSATSLSLYGTCGRKNF